MQFGAHESIAGGVFNAITRGQTATCDTVQIFNKSNSQWRAKKLTQEEIDEYLERIEDTGVTVACSHSSYLINIGSPDEALGTKSRNSLQEETERCNRLEIPNLVFHPGSHVGSGEEPGLDRIAERCNHVLSNIEDNTVALCFENDGRSGHEPRLQFRNRSPTSSIASTTRTTSASASIRVTSSRPDTPLSIPKTTKRR